VETRQKILALFEIFPRHLCLFLLHGGIVTILQTTSSFYDANQTSLVHILL